MVKTTEAQKDLIQRMRLNGASIYLISKATGVNVHTVFMYIRKMGLKNRIVQKMSAEQVREVRISEESIRNLAKRMNVSVTAVRYAKSRNTYKWVD